MKRHSPLDYAYSIGRVRALENFMIERSALRQAAAAPDLSAALKIVYEAGRFPERFLSLRTPAEVDLMVKDEEIRLASLISELLVDNEAREIFFLSDRPQEALCTAENFGCAFITDYLKRKIDLSNIKIFLRLKYLERAEERIRLTVIHGGFIDERLFHENWALSISDFGEKLASTPYRPLWEDAIRGLMEKETFIDLERGIEDFLMGHLKRAKYMIFGPEPVYAFGLAKRSEFGLVRMIVIGRIHQLPADRLQQRISETYV